MASPSFPGKVCIEILNADQFDIAIKERKCTKNCNDCEQWLDTKCRFPEYETIAKKEKRISSGIQFCKRIYDFKKIDLRINEDEIKNISIEMSVPDLVLNSTNSTDTDVYLKKYIILPPQPPNCYDFHGTTICEDIDLTKHRLKLLNDELLSYNPSQAAKNINSRFSLSSLSPDDIKDILASSTEEAPHHKVLQSTSKWQYYLTLSLVIIVSLTLFILFMNRRKQK